MPSYNYHRHKTLAIEPNRGRELLVNLVVILKEFMITKFYPSIIFILADLLLKTVNLSLFPKMFLGSNPLNAHMKFA